MFSCNQFFCNFEQLSVFPSLSYSLSESRFPTHLLPRVVTVPAVAGRLKCSWHGVPVGVTVGVALGDMQCSILAAEPSTTDAGNTSKKLD